MPTAKPKRKPSKALKKPATAPGTISSQRVVHTVKQTGGVRVTEDVALTCSTVWGCVLFIAESLASLPFRHLRAIPKGGSEVVDQSVVDWIINRQANPETTAYQWRLTKIVHALTWGNGYSEVERDLVGRPVWAWQLTPDRVKVERTQRGNLVYDVANPRQPNTVLLPEDVIHLKGLSFDGLVGYGVIQYAAKSIGAALASQESATTFYGNDATPGGLLKHPRRLSENARKDLLESWQARHGGSRNRRTIALLEEGLEWQQTGLPPEVSQLVEMLQFSPVDITRWFRVPPHKVGVLDRATFSNIAQQEIQSVIDCLLPWAVSLEQEINVKLFGRTQQGGNFVKHNFKGRLRGDPQMQGQFYQMMLDRGVFCINDVLDFEDMNPIGADGDQRFVQRNMITLDQAGMPEPAPAKALPAATPADKPAEPMSHQLLLRPIIDDAMRRLLRREANAVCDQLKTGKPMAEWFPVLASKQEAYLHDFLKPGIQTLAAARGADGDGISNIALNSFAIEYNKDLEGRCREPKAEPTEQLADKYVELLMSITLALAETIL